MDTHSTQSMPAQETQDRVVVNVSTTAGNRPIPHPSRSMWREHTTEDIREKVDAIND